MDDMNNLNQNPQPVPPTQPVYGQPEVETPISVGEWVLTIFLTCIPCVNIILLCIWAFGSNTQKTKSNWAKAQLVWVAIGVVISIIFYAIAGASMMTMYG